MKKNPIVVDGITAIASAIVKTIISFIRKPAVIANIQHIFNPNKLGIYSTKEVKEVEENADLIADFLKNKGIRPNRIGIDGLPGAGKSTLANALSNRLKMEWISLDYQLSNEPFHFNKNNSIYEHQRLFRTQDIDVFDIILFMDLPVEKIKKQIIYRGQGAFNIEIFDYDLMQEVGRIAFDIADGKKIRIPNSHICMKIRPKGGFNVTENLENQLEMAGFVNTGNLTKEEKIFLLIEGKAKRGKFANNLGSKYAMELLANVREYFNNSDHTRRKFRH